MVGLDPGIARLRIPDVGSCRIVGPRVGGRRGVQDAHKGVPCRRRGGRNLAGTAAVLQASTWDRARRCRPGMMG